MIKAKKDIARYKALKKLVYVYCIFVLFKQKNLSLL